MPRFPPPPRTPSLRAPSPTVPEFRPEESPSFDKRLTPVVPASWPEEKAAGAHFGPAPAEQPPVTTSQPSASISLSPAAASERAFWDEAPQYSMPPPVLVTDPPRPRPSQLRTWLTRVLFTSIVGIVLALLYYEASIVYHVPWQNPRLLMERIRLG